MSKALSPIESEFATEEEAEAYDRWFRAQIQDALREADDPRSPRHSHEEVMADAQAVIDAKSSENKAHRVA